MGGERDEEQAEVKAKKTKTRKNPKNKARGTENSLTNFWETRKCPGEMTQMSLNLCVTHHTTYPSHHLNPSRLKELQDGSIFHWDCNKKTKKLWTGPSTAELQS